MKTEKLRALACILLSGFLPFRSIAQGVNPSLFNCMQWRMIGPFRGGRTVGACGVNKQPNVFYIGVNDGGVWKTDDYGRTWNPVFDSEPTGSIGDVAVAQSNPEVIYAGSGEGLQRPDLSVGNGIYKSVDGGKTWKNMGLGNGMQVGGLAVDPTNENRVFAAILGHPYAANTERGVYRTVDGGKSWSKVLYVDENTGAMQVTIDPANPNVIYADLWAARMAPWENGYFSIPGNCGLYKSTDGGTTWKKLLKGLPSAKDSLGRIGFCIVPNNTSRLYATVDAEKDAGGIYRSDDAGESWTKMNNDMRLWDRGDDFAELKADPKNADVVYDANVMVWKSADGGKTWNGFKGAPGGDDYHRFWINPVNPDIMLLAGDQGAIVTVNGGTTWSSWYNQPTAQLYHVSADNAFPYNVYSGQQESGSVGIASRGNDGEITMREWHPVGAEEYGYVVADPKDPDIIYGGKISKYDKRTGQVQDISPDAAHSGKYRFIRTAPIVFSPVNGRTLFFAGNVLFRTDDGGNSWRVLSPDLTRPNYDVAPCIGIFRKDSLKDMPGRGVIYTIAPSPVDSNVIWCGTDDGYIQVTADGGKSWANVTPPGLTSWSKISLIDASHTDANTAYAAVNGIRLDDMQPHIYKTTDRGKTWKEIVNGLPDQPINAVKEDPVKKGLLFAASQTGVSVSFDDGNLWQTLRLNMPATSIRDLTIKDNDLIAATHGRSFWILDDITPLRECLSSGGDKTMLYKPEPAYRVRWDMNTDTPFPADEPAGKNPPDGAIIDYYLKDKAENGITLDIMDSAGNIIRHYSSGDSMYKIPPVNIPLYWIRPQLLLSADSGSHRFLWDMHYTPLQVPPSYSIGAVVGETPPAPTSPWVMPGAYRVRLTVSEVMNKKKHAETGGTGNYTVTVPITVLMDPRVHTSDASLKRQYNLSMICYNDAARAIACMKEVNTLKTKLVKEPEKLNMIYLFEHTFAPLLLSDKNLGDGSATEKKSAPELVNLPMLEELLRTLLAELQSADVQPTTQCIEKVMQADAAFGILEKKWAETRDSLGVSKNKSGKK